VDFAVLGSIRILKNVLFGREKVVSGPRLIAGGTRLLRGSKPLRLPRAVKLPPRAQVYGPIWVNALQNRAPSPPRAQCPRGGQEYFATKKFVKIPLPGRGIPREGNPSPFLSALPLQGLSTTLESRLHVHVHRVVASILWRQHGYYSTSLRPITCQAPSPQLQAVLAVTQASVLASCTARRIALEIYAASAAAITRGAGMKVDALEEEWENVHDERRV